MTYTNQSHCSATFEAKKNLKKPENIKSWKHIIMLLDNLSKLSVVLDNLEPETTKNKKLLKNLSNSLENLYVELNNFEKSANVYFQNKASIAKIYKEKNR